LLCSLAAQAPGGKALPETRGQLYERMLRWFLTGGHRSVDDPGAPARDNLQVRYSKPLIWGASRARRNISGTSRHAACGN
jgi:hypothetical protein